LIDVRLVGKVNSRVGKQAIERGALTGLEKKQIAGKAAVDGLERASWRKRIIIAKVLLDLTPVDRQSERARVLQQS